MHKLPTPLLAYYFSLVPRRASLNALNDLSQSRLVHNDVLSHHRPAQPFAKRSLRTPIQSVLLVRKPQDIKVSQALERVVA